MRLQEHLLWEQVPFETKMFAYSPETLGKMLTERGQSCMQRNDGEKGTLSCDLNSDSRITAHNLQIDLTLSLHMLLRNVESQAQKISEQMSKGRWQERKKKWQETKKNGPSLGKILNLGIDINDNRNPPTKETKYPAHMDVPMMSDEFDESGWPTRQQCGQWKLDLETNNIYPVYLPPENKGYE